MMSLRGMNMPLSAIRILPYVDFGIDLYGHALIVRPDYAQKNPEVIRNFIRGVVHGFNAMIKDRDGAIASLKQRDSLLDSEVEKERIQVSLDYRMITDNVLRNGAKQCRPGAPRALVAGRRQGVRVQDHPERHGDLYGPLSSSARRDEDYSAIAVASRLNSRPACLRSWAARGACPWTPCVRRARR
jgi:hypothetical protein